MRQYNSIATPLVLGVLVLAGTIARTPYALAQRHGHAGMLYSEREKQHNQGDTVTIDEMTVAAAGVQLKNTEEIDARKDLRNVSGKSEKSSAWNIRHERIVASGLSPVADPDPPLDSLKAAVLPACAERQIQRISTQNPCCAANSEIRTSPSSEEGNQETLVRPTAVDFKERRERIELMPAKQRPLRSVLQSE